MSTIVKRPSSARQGTFTFADLTIAVLIFGSAVWLGLYAVEAFRESGGHQAFYQSEFGPAAMFACGHGLANPDTRGAPALEAFLDERADSLDCADIPATTPKNAMDAFQRATRYLEVAVALIWKLTGLSWPRLAILPALLFGAVAVLTYGIFRLALSRRLALAGMVPTFMSTSGLMLVPQIRDYAKGPFLLAVIFCMGLLVVGPTDRLRALVISALAGATVGLGLGFRTDLVIAVVPFLVTVAFLLPTLTLPARLAAMAVFLAAFVVLAYPLLGDYSHGNNIGPVALLGLSAPFDEPLGIEPSIYEFGSQYSDSLAFTIVASYVVRVEGRREAVDLATPDHARASMTYLTNIAAVFPADVVTRTVAAMRLVPRYFLESSLYPPSWVRSRFVLFLYRLRASLSSRLAFLAVPALVIVTVLLSLAHPRAAWLILIVMVGFVGASAVQFNERHFFYLQFVPWWTFGFLAEAAFRAPAWIEGSATTRLVAAGPATRHAMIMCTAVVVTAGMLIGGSRLYQSRTAARLFETYEAAGGVPLVLTQSDAGVGRTLLSAREWLEPLPSDAPRIRTSFFSVRFRDDLCQPGSLPLTIRYQATLPELDFSETLLVQLRGDTERSTRVFVPTYDRPEDTSRFRGIEIPSNRLRCVAEISRVQGIDRTPLLLTTTLVPDWRAAPLYQRLR
ncbi:MAG TPA: hypothetical protein VNZ26_11330 [Vicinamibacterales bacterium]|nr:hypothetical protein [Vicinamibacterales bacterium]